MTKRLAIAMLTTVWAILIAAGLTAYLTTRSVVLTNMDQAMVDRTAPWSISDRGVVKNELGQRVEVGSDIDHEKYKPTLISARFVTLDDGTRERTVSVHTWILKDGKLEPVIWTQSESAASFGALMRRLAWALVIVGSAGGGLAAAVAGYVARAALRPLRGTADAIGRIDERNLSRRIDASDLPPELLPVAHRLNEMLSRLETSFENRKRFLADASHELRTPVAALVTTLEVSLRRLRDAESYRDTIQTSLADARLLRTLVEALMKQARSELGAFAEEALATDVTRLLRESLAILNATAADRNVALRDAIEEGIQVEVPPGRFKQAIMGLLENAIDHNQAGGTVELAATLEGNELRICVSDTGPGIAAEHLPRIFEPFYRASRSRETGGHLGLGLYLVKTHVDAMGGRCLVRSVPGQGSEFKVVLPVRRIAEKPFASALAR